MFAILCLVWGSTWLAMKAGITAVPPGFFSGTRWTAAGLVLAAFRVWRGLPVGVALRFVPRVVLVAVLMISFNASIQLYGLRHVGSGLAAVITAGTTPLALLGFGIALGQERFSRKQAVAIGLGLLGIVLLFGPKTAAGQLGWTEIAAALAVLVGCLCYCAGSVLVRPLMRASSPAQIAALTNLIGGVALLVVSLAIEPGAWRAARFDWGWPAWSGWLFLLFFGSLGASVIYLLLVRDWGASRTGNYAFVSPVIAVALGILVYDEPLGALDAIGMALMLSAAGVALRGGK